MKKAYDFDKQIQMMNQIFQSNISLAQNANLYLKNMSLSLIKKAVRQLKETYQEQYLKSDQQKYNSIRYTLNLIVNQKVTNVDELFIQLGFLINSYYGIKYIDIRKKIPYFKKCNHCEQNVSNYNYGIKNHEIRCSQNQKINKTASRKKLELVEHSKENQCIENQIDIKQENCVKMVNQECYLSKKQALTAKINRKRLQIWKKHRKLEKEQAYRGFMNFDHYDINMCLVGQASSVSIKLPQEDNEQCLTTSAKTLSTQLQSSLLQSQRKMRARKLQDQQNEFF